MKSVKIRHPRTNGITNACEHGQTSSWTGLKVTWERCTSQSQAMSIANNKR